MNVLAFGGIGPWEVVIVTIVALLIFGKRLPEVARSVGKSLSAFKKGLSETEDEIEQTGQTGDSGKKGDGKSGK